MINRVLLFYQKHYVNLYPGNRCSPYLDCLGRRIGSHDLLWVFLLMARALPSQTDPPDDLAQQDWVCKRDISESHHPKRACSAIEPKKAFETLLPGHGCFHPKRALRPLSLLPFYYSMGSHFMQAFARGTPKEAIWGGEGKSLYELFWLAAACRALREAQLNASITCASRG
jgi:hypothetical protein